MGSKWIPCSVSLPYDKEYVLVTTDKGIVTEAFYSARKKCSLKRPARH